jgi:hypothetical protein
MKLPAKMACVLLLGVLLVGLGFEPAYAYADPGTGGLLYQIIIVFLAVIASYFAFLKDWVRRFFSRRREDPSNEETKSD